MQLTYLQSFAIKQLRNRYIYSGCSEEYSWCACSDQIWRLTEWLLDAGGASDVSHSQLNACMYEWMNERTNERIYFRLKPKCVLVLHCHQDKVDDLNVAEIAREFARMTPDEQLLETSLTCSFVCINNPSLQCCSVKFYVKRWHGAPLPWNSGGAQ